MKALRYAVAALVAACSTSALAGPLDGKSWDDIVAQAKQEGELTWYVWYLQDDLRRAIKPFEEQYGIKVTIPEGDNAANFDKLLAEKGREKGDIDVFTEDFSAFEKIQRSEFFQPLSILPEDAGRVGNVAGIDGQGYVTAFWGNQTGIAYDKAVLGEADLPQTPEEFAAFWTAHPGKFGFNYEKGGSGPSFYQNVLRVITGVDMWDGEVTDAKVAALQPGYDFFNANATNYVITASNADSITRLNDRELLLVPTWEDFLAGLQKSGEVRKDIGFYIPKMGMNGGGNGVAIPLNAPHPAAAAVFINWLTSPETQTALNRDFGTAPMNKAADSTYALVSQEQRVNTVRQGARPFIDTVIQGFIDNVILER
jgi:putative spermidine/putrescine transport system substrate-binding protein